MKPELLITHLTIGPDYLAKFGELATVHNTPSEDDRQAAIADGRLANVRAVLTSSSQGISRELLDAMPKLELLCCNGVGYDKLDLADLRRRGLMVTHSPGVISPFVAEHAIALLLATVRRIPQVDGAVRRGDWAKARDQLPTVLGGRVGIVGLGQIGREVARRAAAGFDMSVAYHGRRPHPDVAYRYYGDLKELAAVSDFLVLSCSGDESTRHIVDAGVLEALGPEGYLVNVARGSVVDTAALTDALRRQRIAGAGLDVIEGEPDVPADILALPNVVITPHLGGRSTRAQSAMLDLVIRNLQAHFAGQPAPTPIPEWRAGAGAAVAS